MPWPRIESTAGGAGLVPESEGLPETRARCTISWMAEIPIGGEARGEIVSVGPGAVGTIAAENGERFFFAFAEVVDEALLTELARLLRVGSEDDERLSIPTVFVNKGKRRAGDDVLATAGEVRASEMKNV